MTEEHVIQNRIREALSPYVIIFRANVGSGMTYDGRYFSTDFRKVFPTFSECGDQMEKLYLLR